MFVKENGFVHNFVANQIRKTSWKNALNILGIDVFYDLSNLDIVKIKSQSRQPNVYYIVSNPSLQMAVCGCLDEKRGNMCKHVTKEYMYIKGSSPYVPSSFPHMAPPMKETLLLVLSLTLILNYNNFEGECSTTQFGKGDEEEKPNQIDEHANQWVHTKFSKDIDHCILMKFKNHMFILEVARCTIIMKRLRGFSSKQLCPLKNMKRDNVGTSYSHKRLRRFIESYCKKSTKRKVHECLQFPSPSGLTTTKNHTRCGIQNKKQNCIPLPGTYHQRRTRNNIGSLGQED